MSHAISAHRRAKAAIVEPVEQPQYLTFRLAGETYALDILHIKEIIEYGGLTEVPMMPRFLRGVINLRGAVVPVIDLAVRFGRPATDIGKRSCIIIVEVQADDDWLDLGVIVDAVDEVLDLPADAIEPAPAFGAQLRAEFIRGMGKLDGRFVIVLALEHVLSIDEMALLVGDDATRPEK
ncbi:purine-binding chemotaxis protein CheW [Chitinimonas arctica]|uniref:Purine-binding chemotaxis protein CheW n=1 Tax=Chitinimonas arctica TaxID=2594795 RepID=A0A516SI67_9NEIS|nr:chemotaxis protein CheW [Chitinimonas arctica]QDQ27835.1 purine-binding chemotaxis protein CheW [Chitinimonas arctica]